MRSPPTRAAGALLTAAAALLAGCNDIFGLAPVSQKGGDGPCPDPEVPGNLVVNGSFEDDSAWTPSITNDAGEVAFVQAESCDLACGDRIARLSGKAAHAEYLTLMLRQSVGVRVELGGTLRLGARYAYESEYAPYFSLTANGWNIGPPQLKGTKEGDHYLIDDLELAIDDPRRAEEHVELDWVHGFEGEEAVSLLDCVSLAYEPPGGAELLSNGWFEGQTEGWTALGDAELSLVDLPGLCGPTGGLITLPAGTKADALGTSVTGSWPANTTFRFGGAAGSQKYDDPPIAPFSIVLRADYADDMDAGTEDFAEAEASSSTTSEPWEMATGTLTATRPVTSVSIRLVPDTTAPDSQLTLVADCFTVRALP